MDPVVQQVEPLGKFSHNWVIMDIHGANIYIYRDHISIYKGYPLYQDSFAINKMTNGRKITWRIMRDPHHWQSPYFCW
jgi:hypothetical protein